MLPATLLKTRPGLSVAIAGMLSLFTAGVYTGAVHAASQNSPSAQATSSSTQQQTRR